MDANHPIVIDSDSDTADSGEKVALEMMLSLRNSHNNSGNAVIGSTEARFEVALGCDQNLRQRQPVGVLVVVESRGQLDGAAGQMLRSLSQQVDEALNYFTLMTRRGQQYALDDREFLEWITDAGTRRRLGVQDRVTYGVDNLTRILTRRPPMIELEMIPGTSVEAAFGEDVPVNGLKKRTLVYQEPAPVGHLDDVALKLDAVTSLELQVQEMAREGRVRSVRIFRVWDVEIII